MQNAPHRGCAPTIASRMEFKNKQIHKSKNTSLPGQQYTSLRARGDKPPIWGVDDVDLAQMT